MEKRTPVNLTKFHGGSSLVKTRSNSPLTQLLGVSILVSASQVACSSRIMLRRCKRGNKAVFPQAILSRPCFNGKIRETEYREKSDLVG